MAKPLTFVFGGGGSRGAMQVGACYALLEHGLQPDLLVGTSIGAVNAAFIALNGFSKNNLDRLKAAWEEVVQMDLLPANYVWLAVRAMLGRSTNDPSHKIKELFIRHGITPDLRFSDLSHPALIIVSSDLNTGRPVRYGLDPDDKILDALLVSTALPPWTMPVKKQDRLLVDGGLVSSLPVETAIRAGAAGIVALDLVDVRETPMINFRLASFVSKISNAVEKRQSDLEVELAEALGIPTIYIGLMGDDPVPIWDFSHSSDLINHGYEIARQILEDQPEILSKFNL